jgi:hypothetical protein
MISYYLPEKESSLTVYGKNIKIRGYSKVLIEVERLRGEYSVWVNTSDAKVLVSGDSLLKDVIFMGSMDLDQTGLYSFDTKSVNCKFKKLVYHGIYHSYLITFEFPLNKAYVADNTVSPQKKDNEKSEYTRFKMMDIDGTE